MSKQKRALVVDDSKSARLVLRRMLEKHDLAVDTVESAGQALEWGVATGAAAALSCETVGYAAADVQRLRERCKVLSADEFP